MGGAELVNDFYTLITGHRALRRTWWFELGMALDRHPMAREVAETGARLGEGK